MVFAVVGLGILTVPLVFTLCVFAWSIFRATIPVVSNRPIPLQRDPAFWWFFTLIWLAWMAGWYAAVT